MARRESVSGCVLRLESVILFKGNTWGGKDLFWASGCNRVPAWLTRTDLC